MTKIILKGHKGIGGVAEGEALVSQNAISYMSDTGGVFDTPMTARVTNKVSLPELYGQSLADKVLVFPSGKGGIFSSALLLGLVKHGLGPRAMINIRTHPVFTLASILTGIPTVDLLDRNPLEVIKTGDWVKVDAEKGIVEVTKKQ
jgi:predicted aconitase with swiveling domain